MEPIQIDDYTWVKLEDSEKYGIKILEGWMGRDGEFRPNFCKRSFKKDGEEKNVPVAVKFGGDKKQARQLLSDMLDLLCDDKEDDDISF